QLAVQAVSRLARFANNRCGVKLDSGGQRVTVNAAMSPGTLEETGTGSGPAPHRRASPPARSADRTGGPPRREAGSSAG
ncbi:hypothetical protein B4Q13_25665, partial [Lacticaseibacillus rhamnosus]